MNKKYETLIVRPKASTLTLTKDRASYQGPPLTLSYFDKRISNTYSVLEDGKELEGPLSSKSIQYAEKEITFKDRLEYRLSYDPSDKLDKRTIEANAILNHPFVRNINKPAGEQNRNYSGSANAFFDVEIVSESSNTLISKTLETFNLQLEFFKLPKEEYLDVAYAMLVNPKGLDAKTLVAKLADSSIGAIVANPKRFNDYLADRENNRVKILVNQASVMGLFGDSAKTGAYVSNNVPIGRTIDEVVAYYQNNEIKHRWLREEVEGKANQFSELIAELRSDSFDLGVKVEQKKQGFSEEDYKKAVAQEELAKNEALEKLDKAMEKITSLTKEVETLKANSSKGKVAVNASK